MTYSYLSCFYTSQNKNRANFAIGNKKNIITLQFSNIFANFAEIKTITT